MNLKYFYQYRMYTYCVHILLILWGKDSSVEEIRQMED